MAPKKRGWIGGRKKVAARAILRGVVYHALERRRRRRREGKRCRRVEVLVECNPTGETAERWTATPSPKPIFHIPSSSSH